MSIFCKKRVAVDFRRDIPEEMAMHQALIPQAHFSSLRKGNVSFSFGYEGEEGLDHTWWFLKSYFKLCVQE